MRLIDLDGDFAVSRHSLQPFGGQPAGIGHRAAHEHRIFHLAIAIRLDDATGVAEIGIGQSRLFVR